MRPFATCFASNMTMRISVVALLVFLLAGEIAYGQQEKTSASPSEPSTPEAIKQFNDEKVAELAKQIAGKEDQPAETVFKNIKILTGVPAGNLLKIMQIGYSRALGVSCSHCHVPGHGKKTTNQPSKSPGTCRRWLTLSFLTS